MKFKKWFSRKQDKKTVHLSTGPGYRELENSGERFLKQLSHAIQEESLPLKILSIIWVAGPVTYIALKLSFWVGYGREAPSELIFYVAVYGAITGVITIVVNIFHRAITREKTRRTEALLAETLAKIPDLIVMFRNLRISQLIPEEQIAQSAQLLLRDPDASESSIQTAIEDLTGNLDLARSYRVIESYRKKGAAARIQLEVNSVLEKHAHLLIDVWCKYPYLRAIMESRLRGRAPSKRLGQKRRPDFLKELIISSDTLRPQTVELAAGEELLKLVLELLLDREFKIVLWNFVGESSLSALFKKLDRRKIKLGQLRKSKRQLLREMIDTIEHKDDSPFAFFESLNNQILTNSAQVPERLSEVRGEISESALEIAQLQNQINKHEELVSATQDKLFEALSHRTRFDDRTGIRVESRTLKLTDKQKVAMAEDLSRYFSSIAFRSDKVGLVAIPDDDEIEGESRALGIEEVRTLIFKLFLIVDRHLDLSREYVIDSLEASRSFNLMMLDPSLSRRTKIGWMTAVLEELEDDNKPAVERSARRLQQQCGSRMPPTFAKTYEKVYGLKMDEIRSVG